MPKHDALISYEHAHPEVTLPSRLWEYTYWMRRRYPPEYFMIKRQLERKDILDICWVVTLQLHSLVKSHNQGESHVKKGSLE